MNTTRLFAALLAVTFLTGCFENTSPDIATKPTEDARSINPCSLLTREEIATAMGQQVTEASVRTSPKPNCRYAVGEGSVTIFVFNDPSAAGAFQTGKRMQDAQPEAVSGVGDEAYWSPGIKTLNILKGKVYLTVQYYGVRSGSKDSMQALAQKALARLQ